MLCEISFKFHLPETDRGAASVSSFLSNPQMEGFLKYRYPKLAGWFNSWKIPSINGWWLGVPFFSLRKPSNCTYSVFSSQSSEFQPDFSAFLLRFWRRRSSWTSMKRICLPCGCFLAIGGGFREGFRSHGGTPSRHNGFPYKVMIHDDWTVWGRPMT